MANLTKNFNYLQPTNFKAVIDRQNYPNLEFFVQDFTHPGVIMNPVEMNYKKIASVPFIGDKLTYTELLINIILDEDMKSYTEMHNWMRRVLDQDMTTPIDRFKAKTEKPPAESDITLSILSSHNNPIKRIQYVNCIPIALTDIQFASTQGGEAFITFGASFRFTYFNLLTKNTTGQFVDSFNVTGTVGS